MPKRLTLSVGIPAYNQGEYLEETIVSLLQQTRPPDEIVISDQYSTDSTPDVIAKYARHVRSVKPPLGVNLAGQYSFTLASQTGDWVSLLSSDDVAKPNFCEVLARGAARRDDAVLVRAAWENMDSSGKFLKKDFLLSVKSATLPPDNLFEQRNGPKVGFAAFALQRKAFEAVGPILPAMESLADWALWLQLAPFGAFIYEPEIISRYRMFQGQDKFHDRLGMWIRDEVRIFYDIMPRSAQQAGIADTAWIDAASHDNFHRYLSAADQRYAPADRAAIVPLFADWAARTGNRDILARFAEGDSVAQAPTLKSRLKSALRPAVQNLYARLHRS